jgi:ribosomal protein S18 acetylase RimI-like enzyme
MIFNKPAVLSETHALDDFDSGAPSLDSFLKRIALKSQQQGHSRTFVIADNDSNVVGYYALCAGSAERDDTPRQIGGHGAPREIPVALLARLAVDRNYQSRQLGSVLMRHAFASVISASEFVGFRAIVVHALDEQAVGFYKKFGFRSAGELDMTLFLSVQDALRIIQRAT